MDNFEIKIESKTCFQREGGSGPSKTPDTPAVVDKYAKTFQISDILINNNIYTLCITPSPKEDEFITEKWVEKMTDNYGHFIPTIERYRQVIKAELKNGIEGIIQPILNKALIHYCAEFGLVDCIELIGEYNYKNLNLNVLTNNGKTPLDIALENNRMDAYQKLIEIGCDLTTYSF